MIDNYLDIKSIDPLYWGKSGWIFLNSIALTYKPEYKEKYKLFMEQCPYILPCITCGDNLKKNMNTLDNALESKEKFLRWLLEIRNNISKENFRLENIKTLKDNFNEIFFQTCNNSQYYYIIVLIVLFVILIFIYKSNNN
jgi:hypothetical protein